MRTSGDEFEHEDVSFDGLHWDLGRVEMATTAESCMR